MSNISKKLKSNTGASLIIALMFMLICVFVGGSVLAAASVNGGRLSHSRKLQQEVISQRSMASTIVNYLSNTNGKLSLVADDVTTDAVYKNQTGIRYALLQSAYKAAINSEDTTVSFTVTTPDGATPITHNCYVVCSKGSYQLNIHFASDSANEAIVLQLYATKNGNSVTWDKCKIVKAVNS